MFIIGILLLGISIFGLIITSAMYICLVGMSKMFEGMIEVLKKYDK